MPILRRFELMYSDSSGVKNVKFDRCFEFFSTSTNSLNVMKAEVKNSSKTPLEFMILSCALK